MTRRATSCDKRLRSCVRSQGITSVADEGRGIAAGELARLFRGYRGGAAGDRRGADLGLAICKGLVEAHRGRTRAESAGPGRGSRFTFTLPAAETGARRGGATRPGGRDPARTRPRAGGGRRPGDAALCQRRPRRRRLRRAGHGRPRGPARILAAERPDLVHRPSSPPAAAPHCAAPPVPYPSRGATTAATAGCSSREGFAMVSR